jgi:hypothetical protein
MHSFRCPLAHIGGREGDIAHVRRRRCKLRRYEPATAAAVRDAWI